MSLFNTTSFGNQTSKFGPAIVSYSDDTVGEITYLSWINLYNDVCIARVFLGDEITFGDVINLNRKATCAPTLSVNPFICDSRINVSWVNKNEGKIGVISVNVENTSTVKYVIEADIKMEAAPAIFPFFNDQMDGCYRNECCFIYKDKQNNIKWSASTDGINYSSNQVYTQGNFLKSLTTPVCVGNNLIWTSYDTHQIYTGTITNCLLDGVFSMHIENVKRVGGMSSASPAVAAFAKDAEVVLCYRGHTYKQLFVQLFGANSHSIVRQTQLGVESDFSPAICNFRNTPWIAWTDKNNSIQVATLQLDKYRVGELVG